MSLGPLTAAAAATASDRPLVSCLLWRVSAMTGSGSDARRRVFDAVSLRRGHFHPCLGPRVASLEASADASCVLNIVSVVNIVSIVVIVSIVSVDSVVSVVSTLSLKLAAKQQLCSPI